jgi:hypothetical protein
LTEALAARSVEPWEQLLDVLEERLGLWRSALEGKGDYPDELRLAQDPGPCPDHLLDRARRINAAQRDLCARLSLRREALGALLRSDGRLGHTLTTPLFVDQRS